MNCRTTVFSFVMFAIGCDEPVGHGPDASTTTCDQIAVMGCTKACDCDPGVECILSYAGGVVTAKHPDFGACTRFASFVCGSNATSETDKQGCLQALAPAQCTTATNNGTQYGALAVPPICKDDL